MRPSYSNSRRRPQGGQTRAERRKASALKPYLRFNRAVRASGNAIETYVVAAADGPGLIYLAAAGVPTAETLATAILSWAEQAEKREVLCLDCDQRFGPSIAAPAAFTVAVPFAAQSPAMVAGVCEACASKGRENMERASLRRMRTIWPNAYSIGRPGRA